MSSASKKKIGVFHPGKQHSWQTALAFSQNGTLKWYATSLHYDPSALPYIIEKCLPNIIADPVKREFSRHRFDQLPLEYVRRIGIVEWVERFARRARFDRVADRLNVVGNVEFGRRVMRLMEAERVDLVWGYDTASLEVFQQAKRSNIACVLDQTIGHPAEMNSVMLKEKEIHPEFFPTYWKPWQKKDIERQNEEMKLADLIVVGSHYAANTLMANGCEPSKIRIVPYGFDDTLFPPEFPIRRSSASGPVNLLFVGTIGPRKGVAHLLKTVSRFPRSEIKLTLVGRLEIPGNAYGRFSDRVETIQNLPQSELANYYFDADVFVFPSLFEGSALVLSEAIGSSLGIIQSKAAGSGVNLEENGVILDEVSSDCLEQAMANLLKNRAYINEWQRASWNLRGNASWTTYRNRLSKVIEDYFS